MGFGFLDGLFNDGGKGENQEIIDLYNELDTPNYDMNDIDAILQQDSSLSNYSADPRLVQSQMDALAALQGVADAEGLTATDRARLEQIQQQENTIERGNREAILQNASARGVGGSGLEIASNLISGQESANRRALEGFNVAADAEQRALDAMMASGQLSGDMRGQQFGEQAQTAQAQDMINQFNTQNQNSFNQYNQQQQNTMKNQAYQDQLAKASGQAAGYSGQATAETADREAILGAAANAAGAVAASDERAKENVEMGDKDIDKFLGSLTNYKYDYKEPQMDGEGKHFSVMAQDMEKTPAGKSMVVYDEFGRKNIDYGKGMGVMLSALKNLSQKIEEK